MHRVARTSTGGTKERVYNFVRAKDAPHLLDLQLFLRKMLALSKGGSVEGSDFASDIIVGSLLRDSVELCMRWIHVVLSKDTEKCRIRESKDAGLCSQFSALRKHPQIGQRGLNKSEVVVVMKARRSKIKIDPSKRSSCSNLSGNHEDMIEPTDKDGGRDTEGIGANIGSSSDADLD